MNVKRTPGMKIRLGASRYRPQAGRHRLRGFTLVEVVVASSISLMVVAGVVGVMLQVGVEQRLGAADTVLEQHAGNLQDQLCIILRSMSAREGTVFTDPATSQDGQPAGFRHIIVARGTAPDFPREELRWNATTRTVIHDPNRKLNGDERTLFRPAESVTLRNLAFSPSVKPDGSVDNSLINVWIEMDDDAWAGRKTPYGSAANTVVQRFFTVKMRNH